MVNATPQLEGLGETLIPAINRLQDIFSQVAAARLDCVKEFATTAAATDFQELLPVVQEVSKRSTPACLQVTLDFRLELPQVAVIGSQSSGKSSVLEALVRHSL